MQIHWYPGHMAKAKRELVEQLKRVDIVIELCDARLPISSRNPDLSKLAQGKKRLLVLGKADMADEQATRQWVQLLKRQGIDAISFNAVRGRASEVLQRIDVLTADAVSRAAARGIRKTVRAMVVGIPNVGKSTFINRLHGSAIARAEDRPGVTRANRWVRVSPHLELLDTPGLLWPKLDDQQAAQRLAWLGTIRDEILDSEGLAISLLDYLMTLTPSATAQRYKISDPSLRGDALLEAACLGRGFLLPGGVADRTRGASVILDEFRAGRIGRITLERGTGRA